MRVKVFNHLLGESDTAFFAPARLATLGIADAVPKLIVYRLLRPAMRGLQRVHLVCREEATDRLVAELATAAVMLSGTLR